MFLQGTGLIKLTEKINYVQGMKCTEYTLWDIKKILPDNLYSDLNGEKIVEIDKELVNRLQKEIAIETYE